MSIRKKVANLWAPLLQSKGNSTTQPMSQKAVSDELSKLKSDLVAKANILSYEEIMASTPSLNLDIAIPKASAIKTIESVKKPKIIGSNIINNPDNMASTFTFTLLESRIYLFVAEHQGDAGTNITVIGTYTGSISISNIKKGDYLTLTASGLTLTINFEYGHVWSLIELC